MTAMTMTNKAAYKKDSDYRRLSLMERCRRYFEENGAQIACGLLVLNGSSNAYKMYAELTGRR
ncbi:MAG: hypothetical protein K2N87_15535 [Eubacterium sp.]|nr:hypothetical protein [Eubacterium sp.]